MSPPQHLLSALRTALNHLYEPKWLQTSPLMGLLRTAGLGETSAALRQTLVRAIESLKPAEDIPSQSAAWRPYEILHYRYVQRFSQTQVAYQLGLSVRHLKREQEKALDLLAERLSDELHLNTEADLDSGSEPATTPLSNGDLQWLQEMSPGQTVRLDDVLPTVLGLTQSMAAHYGTRLHVDMAEGLPSLAIHSIALRQILLSLLYIAIRRTAGGTLSLLSTRQGGSVEVRLRVTGLPSKVDFTQEEEESNLAVARQLVKACGSSLQVSPESALEIVLLIPTAEQLTVLVIDDNPDTIRLLQRYASGTRYRVIGVQDPAQVFSVAGEKHPDVIVLDVMMPQLDGWELLGRLKHHPLTSGTPVVACTVLAQKELALSLGANAFLHKPVSRRDFLSALDRLIPAGAP